VGVADQEEVLTEMIDLALEDLIRVKLENTPSMT